MNTNSDLNHLNINLTKIVYNYLGLDAKSLLNRKLDSLYLEVKYSFEPKFDLKEMKEVFDIDLQTDVETASYVSTITTYRSGSSHILVFGCFSGAIYQYDLTNKKHISSNNKLFRMNVSCLLSFPSKDGKICMAAGDDNPCLKFFDTDFNVLKEYSTDLNLHNLYSFELVDDKLLVSTYIRVMVFSTKDFSFLFRLKGHENYIYRVIHLKLYDPEFVATCSYDHNVCIWRFYDRKIEATLKGHTESVWWIEHLSEYNREILASCSSDNTIRLWNLKSKDCVHVFNKLELPNILFLSQKPFFYKNHVMLATRGLYLLELMQDGSIEVAKKHIPDNEQISAVIYIKINSFKMVMVSTNYGGEISVHEFTSLVREGSVV